MTALHQPTPDPAVHDADSIDSVDRDDDHGSPALAWAIAAVVALLAVTLAVLVIVAFARYEHPGADDPPAVVVEADDPVSISSE